MKHISILLALLLISSFLYSQEKKETRPWKERLVIDGNVALQFGNFTLIGGNPQIGYKISDRIVAGAGYSYYLNTFKNLNGIRFNDKLHGPTAFARVLINPTIFARSDFQSLKYVLDSGTDSPGQSFNRNRWFVGGGYRTQISGRLFATGGIYLDLLDPVAQPTFRAGIESGFFNW